MKKAALYTKEKEIGKGSFGTVFLGTVKANGEKVVVKEVELHGLSKKDLKMSLAEVDVLKRLNHTHIIAYRDSYQSTDKKSLNIVMEYAAGGDLGSLVKKRAKMGRKFTEAEILRVAAQCMDAVTSPAKGNARFPPCACASFP